MPQYSGVFTKTQQANASGGSTPPNWTGSIFVTELLIVGGGGSGGGQLGISGGGGAGGALLGSSFYLPLGTYTVTVGGGGAGGGSSTNGQDSVFGTFTAKGGGYGGAYSGGYANSGGCGGGPTIDLRTNTTTYAFMGGSPYGGTNGNSNIALPTQVSPNRNFVAFGNIGGIYGTTNNLAPNGGGGIGAIGGSSNFNTNASGIGPNGGAGLYFTTSGSSVAYGGGGGASGGYIVGGDGAGGVGGGGNPTNLTATASGTANTGGGGGGTGYVAFNNGNGGSGIVALKYPDTYPAASSTTGSPSITVSGGFRYYRWTGSGSITFS